jgi:hypothetical protein
MLPSRVRRRGGQRPTSWLQDGLPQVGLPQDRLPQDRLPQIRTLRV